MKIVWFFILIPIFIALSVLAIQEAEMTDTVWCSVLLSALIMLALWKYRVRMWIGRQWNPQIPQDEFNSARPLAYWWLGMYFFLVGGFLVAMATSQYYGFKIPSAAILGFFSLWWIKYELWLLLLCRNIEGSRVNLNS